MGSLLRSEPMTLIQIIEQNGAARDVINTLGDLGTVQFRDLNQNMQAYKRSFADEVKRCDEMSRRLGFILQQVLSAGLAPQERLVTAALVPLADLDGNLKQTHEELQELKRSEVEVLRSLNAFKEHTHVLKMGGAFSRRGGGSSQPPTPRDEPSTSMSFLEEGMPLGPLSLKAPLKGGMGGGGTGGGGKGGGDDAMLNCVTGTIPRARAGAFVRAVHRVTRGNCMATDAPIDELLLDDDKRDPQPTAKNFFMVFTQGHVLLAKLTKLCVHFGATVRCAALRSQHLPVLSPRDPPLLPPPGANGQRPRCPPPHLPRRRRCTTCPTGRRADARRWRGWRCRRPSSRRCTRRRSSSGGTCSSTRRSSGAARSKRPSWSAPIWPPRAHRTASEGVGLPSALVRREAWHFGPPHEATALQATSRPGRHSFAPTDRPCRWSYWRYICSRERATLHTLNLLNFDIRRKVVCPPSIRRKVFVGGGVGGVPPFLLTVVYPLPPPSLCRSSSPRGGCRRPRWRPCAPRCAAPPCARAARRTQSSTSSRRRRCRRRRSRPSG